MNLRLDSDEAVMVTDFDGNALTLRSPRAFAPGSPIRFRTESETPPRVFEGRTIRSTRVDDALFEVRLRLVNLRREDRQFLVSRIEG